MSVLMDSVRKMADGKENWVFGKADRKEPGAKEVEIKVKCIGICGSELHAYHDNHFYEPGNVIGHEFCGEISRVGAEVTDWKVGDRVVAEIYQGACGECEFCRRGMPGFCSHGRYVGWNINGGWAEYFCAAENMLLKLPDEVSYEEGSMIEPVSVLTQALIVNKAPVKGGDVVLVQGCGTIGMIAAMVAKAAGASKVIMTGTDADVDVRFPVAKSLTAVDRIVNIMKEDLKEIILNETEGLGADVIIEASGAEPAIKTMPEYLRTRGTIVVLGEAAKSELGIDWNQFLFKSCSVIFNFGEVHEAWKITMRLLEAGKLELEKLITHRLPLSGFAEGFEVLDSKKGLKVLMYPEMK